MKASRYNEVIQHQPLSLDVSKSYEENRRRQEKVTDQQLVTGRWQHFGRGSLEHQQEAVVLRSPARYDSYPEGWPQDGDYTSFGQIGAVFSIGGENWENYNQLRVIIATDCRNIINPAVTVSFYNDGRIKVPDIYHREGQHIINLINHQEQAYTLDLSSIPRDQVTKLVFSINANGSYQDLPGDWQVTIKGVRIEKNGLTSHTKGWQMAEDTLSYSHLGYAPTDAKLVLLAPEWVGNEFAVVDETGEVHHQGQVLLHGTFEGTYGCCDFSELMAVGKYRLQVATLKTGWFPIDEPSKLLLDSLWKSLNFVFCERCGYPVKGIHGVCHCDVYADYRGRMISFNGGWHDAGDLSQQLVQSAELMLDLALAADAIKEQDQLLYDRYLEEIEWGMDFVLKTRLGEGNRITSAGVSRWTNNQIGDMDDVKARVHNSPYDNFLICGILAKMLVTLPDESDLWTRVLSILELDYQDAMTGFEKAPFLHEPIFWEHTYSTSKSQYLATLIWSAALMRQVTGKEDYLKNLEEWLSAWFDCQEREGIMTFNGQKLTGMFYRDESRKVLQHFNHQAREHLYAYAFQEALAVVAEPDLKEQLLERSQMYGSYLKYLMAEATAYGMIPSGIYHMDEVLEIESFAKQHLLVGEEAVGSYQAQLAVAKEIAPGYYLKQFPVWFSFRGNNGVLLSMGISAAVIGNLLQDQRLLDIGLNQLKWIVGQNPFGQSLMYGVGQNYPAMYTVSSGEMTGELPVGIQTFENEDEPYWPQFNNATYKEVWVGLAGKWSALTAQLMKKKEKKTNDQ